MAENDTDQPPTETGSTSEDVFSLVGNEIRTEILRVLRAEEGVSFSELRARLPIDVEPSQLHYHLQQLVGHFVMKSDSDYHLHAAGEHLCQALHAEIFDHRQVHMSVDPELDCYHCRASVEAIWENGYIRIHCPTCGAKYCSGALNFPFAAFNDEATAFSYFSTYIALTTHFLARTICPSCSAPIKSEFHILEEASGHRKAGISLSCDRCGAPWDLPVGAAVLADTGLIAFCYDHGVDVLSTPFWELKFAATDDDVTIRSTDPWEVALAVTFDGDTLELVVDGDLNVVERNRLDATTEMSASLLDDIQNDATFRDTRQRRDEVVLPDEAACLQSIRRHRWPEAVTCPRCDSSDTTKEGWTSKGAQRYRCHDCDSTFNDLTETFFAEHRLSLPEMFHIIWEMDETTTAEIARHLDRSSQSVLNFIREIEDASDEGSERDR